MINEKDQIVRYLRRKCMAEAAKAIERGEHLAADEETALLPCPFCGRDDGLAIESGGDDPERVACNRCGALGPVTYGKQIELWNRRHTPPVDVERLTEELWRDAPDVPCSHKTFKAWVRDAVRRALAQQTGGRDDGE